MKPATKRALRIAATLYVAIAVLGASQSYLSAIGVIALAWLLHSLQ